MTAPPAHTHTCSNPCTASCPAWGLGALAGYPGACESHDHQQEFVDAVEQILTEAVPSAPLYVITELHLELDGPPPEGEPHPERSPIGPFHSQIEALQYGSQLMAKYGGGTMSVAPLYPPEDL